MRKISRIVLMHIYSIEIIPAFICSENFNYTIELRIRISSRIQKRR